jgi:hypothetical protein
MAITPDRVREVFKVEDRKKGSGVFLPMRSEKTPDPFFPSFSLQNAMP